MLLSSDTPNQKTVAPNCGKGVHLKQNQNQANIGGLPISINELIEALPQDTNEEDNKFIDKLKSEKMEGRPVSEDETKSADLLAEHSATNSLMVSMSQSDLNNTNQNRKSELNSLIKDETKEFSEDESLEKLDEVENETDAEGGESEDDDNTDNDEEL
mgnify:CR=1 FL=1